MSKCFLFIVIVCGLACGRIPAQFDRVVYACGELDSGLGDSAASLFQVVDAKGPIAQDLTAEWLTENQKVSLAVSARACIRVPKGQGSLRIVSSNRLQGLLIKNPEGDALFPTQISLKTLRNSRLGLMCEPRVPLASSLGDDGKLNVQQIADIDLRIKLDDFAEADAWQIMEFRLFLKDQAGQTLLQSTDVPAQDFFLNQKLQLPRTTFPDGTYQLSLELVRVDEMRVPSDSCRFNLDSTAPEKSSLLTHEIFDSAYPLLLNIPKGNEKSWVCIARPLEDCQNFTVAEQYINTKAAGQYILHSYRVDAAGNRSAISQEAFFRDAQAPTISINWLDPFLRKGDGWAVERNQTYRVQAAVQDDSLTSGLDLEQELTKTLQCRVEFIAPTGARTMGQQAICSEGLCQGLRMHDWVPCSGDMAFHLENEWNLLDSKVLISARATDRIGRMASSTASFWLNSIALGRSFSERSFPGDLDLGSEDLRDTAWGRVIFQPHFELLRFQPTFLIRSYLAHDQWRKNVIETDNRNLAPFHPTLITKSYNPKDIRPSVWMATHNPWNFAEVTLDFSQNVVISPNIRTIPAHIQKQLGMDRRVLRMLERGTSETRQLVLLLASELNQRAALVSFVPPDNYQVLAVADADQSLQKINGMALAPQGQLVLLLGDTLMIQDPSNVGFRPLEIGSQAMQGVLALNYDQQGIYGLTFDNKLFTLDFAVDGERAAVIFLEGTGSIPGYRATRPTIGRRSDGSYWLSDRVNQLYDFRPGLDAGWQERNVNSRFYYKEEYTAAERDGSLVARNSSGLRRSIPCSFIDVTDQGLFRSERKFTSPGAFAVAKDQKSQIWRANQILDQIFITQLDNENNNLAQPVKFTDPVPDSKFKLLSDAGGQLWIYYSNGSVYSYDKDRNIARFAFKTAGSNWHHMFFDQFGKLWGSQGGSLKVHTQDGETKTLALPGQLLNMGTWDPEHAWLIISVNRVETHYDLDLKSLQLSPGPPLPSPDFRYGDLLKLNGKQWAIMFTEKHSPSTSRLGSPVAIYEQVDQIWRKSSLQLPALWPAWPAWHLNSGSELKLKYPPKLAFDPVAQTYWMSIGQYAARFKDNEWKFFNPTHRLDIYETESGNFWLDGRGRLVLSMGHKIFYYNPGCYAERELPKGSSEFLSPVAAMPTYR